jgi:hypothetical protein
MWWIVISGTIVLLALARIVHRTVFAKTSFKTREVLLKIVLAIAIILVIVNITSWLICSITNKGESTGYIIGLTGNLGIIVGAWHSLWYLKKKKQTDQEEK